MIDQTILFSSDFARDYVDQNAFQKIVSKYKKIAKKNLSKNCRDFFIRNFFLFKSSETYAN